MMKICSKTESIPKLLGVGLKIKLVKSAISNSYDSRVWCVGAQGHMNEWQVLPCTTKIYLIIMRMKLANVLCGDSVDEG